jgi:hypothetical protein
MVRLLVAALSAVLLSLPLGAAPAQYHPNPLGPRATLVTTARPILDTPSQPHQNDAGIPRMALGGVMLGAVGLAVGGLLIGEATQSDQGRVGGAIAGVSLLLPLGVHLGNNSRGRISPCLVASMLVGAAGMTYALSRDDTGPAVAIAIPITQLVLAIAIERHTTGR